MIHHARCDGLTCEGDCRRVLSRRTFLVGLGSLMGLAAAGVGLASPAGFKVIEKIGPGIVNPRAVHLLDPPERIRGMRTPQMVLSHDGLNERAFAHMHLSATMVGSDLSDKKVVIGLKGHPNQYYEMVMQARADGQS